MSSAVVSTSAALGRSFVFDDNSEPDVYPLSQNAQVGTAALGCPVERSSIALRRQALQTTVNNQQSAISLITPASRLEIRPAPEMVSTGISALDALTGGLPRGCLTEICGPASSGRTTVLLAALAAATQRGEFCAVIDASDALDPHSVAAAGVDLDRMLWVRCGENSSQKGNSPRRQRDTEKKSFKKNNQPQNTCNAGCPILNSAPFAEFKVGISQQGPMRFDKTEPYAPERRLEQVLRATDLLLESGGFGLIVLDLADVPPQSARRIPLTTWFRFRRAVEYKPTILLAIEEHPIAGSCSSLLLQLQAAKRRKSAAHGASRGADIEDEPALKGQKKISGNEQFIMDREFTYPAHAILLTGLNINAELIRSRLERKPARSVAFETKTAWAG